MVGDAQLLLLRRKGPEEPGPSPDESPEDEIASAERRALCCRTCATEVSFEEALFCMGHDTVTRLFPNPYGDLREIYTLTTAYSLDFVGPPTTEFTWFPGYAWEVAYCLGCRTHLGWRFLAVEDSCEPRLFYGLLTRELTGGCAEQ